MPGYPSVRLNGNPNYDGTVDLSVGETDQKYAITLNGNATLRHVVRGIDRFGDGEDLFRRYAGWNSLRREGDEPREPVEIRGARVALPPGSYGACRISGRAVLVLGNQQDPAPSAYEFDELSVESPATLVVLGPVIVRVRGSIEIWGYAGNPQAPHWLELASEGSGITVSGDARVYAYAASLQGEIAVKGASEWVGGVAADRLRIEGNSKVFVRPRDGANALPLVEWLAPQPGSAVECGTPVHLSAAAADLDGEIAGVDFLIGSDLVATDVEAPYEFVAQFEIPGERTVRARAFDDAGLFADSEPCLLHVVGGREPPSIVLTKPVAGSVGRAPAIVPVEAEVSPGDDAVDRVEFSINGIVNTVVRSPPFASRLGPLDVGEYAVAATVFDVAGLFSTATTPLTILPENQGPTVALRSPQAGDSIAAPAAISLQAEASDADGAVTVVEFFDGLTPIGMRSVAPFDLTLLESEVREHLYIARATDDTGAATDSAPLSVMVTPAAPAWTEIPYRSDFEVEDGYAPGAPLPAQWETSGSAIVQWDAAAQEQYIVLGGSNPSALTKRMAGSPGDVVFVDLRVRARVGDLAENSPQIVTSNSAVACVRSGTDATVMVRNRDAWIATGVRVPLDDAGLTRDWTRITLREDYSEGCTDLYVDGVMVAARMLPADPGDRLLAVTAQSGAGCEMLIDSFAVESENPIFADKDDDGMPDGWETAFGLNAGVNDRYHDPDADEVRNVFELVAITDPLLEDSDGDGLPDGWELEWGTDPVDRDDDADFDADGLSNALEMELGSSPFQSDSDRDGLTDYWEFVHGLSLTHDDGADDYDLDTISNRDEVAAGTDPADYYNGVEPVVVPLSGTADGLQQDGTIAVLVTDAGGAPLVNAPFRFSAEQGDHLLSATAAGTAAKFVDVRSDQNGVARAWVKGGTR